MSRTVGECQTVGVRRESLCARVGDGLAYPRLQRAWVRRDILWQDDPVLRPQPLDWLELAPPLESRSAASVGDNGGNGHKHGHGRTGQPFPSSFVRQAPVPSAAPRTPLGSRPAVVVLSRPASR